MKPLLLAVAIMLQCSELSTAQRTSCPANHTVPATLNSSLKTAPVLFTENRGQVIDAEGNPRPDIMFTARSNGAKVFLTGTGIYYQFTRSQYANAQEPDVPGTDSRLLQESLRAPSVTSTHRFALALQGANPAPVIRKEDRSTYTENYYLAHCPAGITGVPAYERIVYEGVYPGIDWVVYTREGGLEYDFIVKPGADPGQIKLKVTDADAVSITGDGGLLMKTSLGEVREAPPQSFINGQHVTTRFTQSADGSIGFVVDAYDATKTLTIDPTVSWASYYGGSSGDAGYCCTTDASGNVILAGYASSPTGIASGGMQNVFGGNYDAFLVKFNSAGARQWATYYGGIDYDGGASCAVDASGNIYMAGETYSASAIASGGFQNTFGGGTIDAFLAKFNSVGVRQWATYYGGSGDERAYACVLDADGNVFVAGETTSATAIASGGFQNTLDGTSDAFLVKFNSAGARHWATYYGGPADDYGYCCAADASGNVFLAGAAKSVSAVASGGFQNTNGGSSDAFLVKFNASGLRQWATYYGGGAAEKGSFCIADPAGNVFLAGTTYSAGGIASGGVQNTFGGLNDAFLVKFNASGIRQWGTYYGGSGNDIGSTCAADANGNVLLSGYTNSGAGIAAGGFQNALGGGYDAFMVMFSSSGSRLWGSYYGGSGDEFGSACALEGNGNIFLTGNTTSPSGIAYGGFQNVPGGDKDAFLLNVYEPTTAVTNSLEHINPGSISIYPNPARGNFTLRIDDLPMDTGREIRVDVLDMAGRLVWHKSVRLNSAHLCIGLGQIGLGQYVLRASSDQGSATKKFELID
jgi:hypothetical protein